MTDSYTAVLDRIVDETHAVILLEDSGGIREEYVIDVEDVPDAGRSDGAVFEAAVEAGDLIDLVYRPEETARRAESAQERFDRLSSRLPDADDG